MQFESKGHRAAVANSRPWSVWRGFGPGVEQFQVPVTATVLARVESEAVALLERRLGAVARIERVR